MAVDLTVNITPAATIAATVTATGPQGTVAVASITETITGTDSAKAVTPAGLSVALDSAPTVLGSHWAFLGDSITDTALSNSAYWGHRFGNIGVGLSNGAMRLVREAGVPGERLDNMLARFDTDITPYAPSVVHLLGGTNDTAQSRSIALIKADVIAIVAKVRAIGARPVIGTVPPTNAATPADRKTRIETLNAWLRSYCSMERIVLVDYFSALVDPATNGLTAAFDSGDGVHPSNAGHNTMGALLYSKAAPFLPPAALVKALNGLSAINMALNGFFTSWTTAAALTTLTISKAATGSTLAAGTYYYKVGYVSHFGEHIPTAAVSIVAVAGDTVTVTIPSYSGRIALALYRSTDDVTYTVLADLGAVTTYADDGAVSPGSRAPLTTTHYIQPTTWVAGELGPGNDTERLTGVTGIVGDVIRMGSRLADASFPILQTITTGFAVGDLLAFSVKMRHVGALSTSYAVRMVEFRIGATGLVTNGMFSVFPTSNDWVTYYGEAVVPATCDTLYLGLVHAGTTGTVDYAEVSVVNLTALGIT